MTLDLFKLVSMAALMGVATAVLISIMRRSRNVQSAIDLDDLLLERGPDGTKQLSKIAAVMFASFVVTSYVILYQTLAGTLTDTAYAAYLAAWVAPMVTAIFKKPAP